jgi:hypothetical protein
LPFARIQPEPEDGYEEQEDDDGANNLEKGPLLRLGLQQVALGCFMGSVYQPISQPLGHQSASIIRLPSNLNIEILCQRCSLAGYGMCPGSSEVESDRDENAYGRC